MLSSATSLKALVIRGSAWTVAGHGVSQLIRLASSLILTRLLFPDAFGVMSLVWVVLYGLEMMSDVGLGPAIIRDKRGADPDFLNTAWTLQVIRGAILWAASCALAYPMASVYGLPELARLIPAAGLSALIYGFGSTAWHACRREMQFRRLVPLELLVQVIGFIATVLWAYLQPGVWALVGGSLIGSLAYAITSHALLPGTRNRFRWESEAARSLFGFGKWIFLSSAFTFLSTQGDRLLLGRYVDMAQLGVYSIAVILSEAIQGLVIKIHHGVLFPAYGKVVREERERLASVIGRARLAIDVFVVLPVAALTMFGSWVVNLLYDQRYHAAGWMLQVLCIRVLMVAVLVNSESCLVVLGRPQYSVVQNICRTIWILAGIPFGWTFFGLEGVVWVVALSEIPTVAVLWVGMARHQLLSPWWELRTVLFTGAGVLLGSALLHVML